jgi:hypothetical protein
MVAVHGGHRLVRFGENAPAYRPEQFPHQFFQFRVLVNVKGPFCRVRYFIVGGLLFYGEVERDLEIALLVQFQTGDGNAVEGRKGWGGLVFSLHFVITPVLSDG